MSFFLPNRLHCFICSNTIAARVDAARLFYAHPDDVGDVAQYGRAWVHRRCWEAWSSRRAWAESASRLLTRQQEVKTTSHELVVCRFDDRDTLLQDTWQTIELTIPRERLKDMVAALETTTSSRILLKDLQCMFVAEEHGLRVTIEDTTERFEVFSLEPGTWKVPLEQIRILQEGEVLERS